MWVKKQQLELDMEQQTGSKQEKEDVKEIKLVIWKIMHKEKPRHRWLTVEFY